MTETEYAENTPEYRVAQLARQGSGLSDEELLKQVGYVPHDGTWHRDDLLAQYRREAEFADRTADGVRAHAAQWAADEHAPQEVVTAYGDHMAARWRAGELDAHTTHYTAFAEFFTQQGRVAADAVPGDGQAARSPADRDAAFSLLLERGWFRGMDTDEASGVTTELLNDFYASGSADLQAFTRDWARPEPEPEPEAGQ